MGVKLKVPYKSQVAPTAGYSHNDCGPASVNMMLAAVGTDVTIDSMYKTGPAANLLSTGLLGTGTLIQLAKAYGLELKRQANDTGLTLDGARQLLDAGRPLLMLMDYTVIVKYKLNSISTSGNFGHFVVMVGYEGDDFLIHDPYQKADLKGFFVWSTKVVEECWNRGYGASGNHYARICLVPPYRIAEPFEPPYPVPEDIKRRLMSKALFEGTSEPRITSEGEYRLAVEWLGDWGKKFETYTVVSGDSISKIAKKLYGEFDLWNALAVYNGLKNPDALEVGATLQYPIIPGLMFGQESPDVPNPDTKRPGENKALPEQKPQEYTNQQVINAFFQVFKKHEPDDSDAYWDAIVRAGIEEVAENRQAKYTGPAIDTLTGVPSAILADIVTMLKTGKVPTTAASTGRGG